MRLEMKCLKHIWILGLLILIFSSSGYAEKPFVETEEAIKIINKHLNGYYTCLRLEDISSSKFGDGWLGNEITYLKDSGKYLLWFNNRSVLCFRSGNQKVLEIVEANNSEKYIIFIFQFEPNYLGKLFEFSSCKVMGKAFLDFNSVEGKFFLRGFYSSPITVVNWNEKALWTDFERNNKYVRYGLTPTFAEQRKIAFENELDALKAIQDLEELKLKKKEQNSNTVDVEGRQKLDEFIQKRRLDIYKKYGMHSGSSNAP